jgi:hypothetical protein
MSQIIVAYGGAGRNDTHLLADVVAVDDGIIVRLESQRGNAAAPRRREVSRPPIEAASTECIVGFRSCRSSAGNATAAAGSARADPTGATTAATRRSITCRLFDDGSCILERVDAGGSTPLVLRPGLQGCGSQYEHHCSQSHRELSHQILLYLQDCQSEESTTTNIFLYAVIF